MDESAEGLRDRVAGLSAYDGLSAETRQAAKDSKGFANHPVGIDALSRAKDADDAIDEAAPPLLSALSI